MTTKKEIFQSVKKRLILGVVLLLPALLYLVLTTGNHKFSSLEVLYPINKEETEYHKIPEFSFSNQNGDTINQTRVENKIWVANFFFTSCPSICPIMNNNLLKVQKELKEMQNFHILSFTVDPTTDTESVLKTYAEETLGADTKNWDFLTGKKTEIYKLAQKGMLLSAEEDITEPGGFYHSSDIIIIDKEGRIRSRKDEKGNVKGAYNAMSDIDIKELIEDIKCLVGEYQLKGGEK